MRHMGVNIVQITRKANNARTFKEFVHVTFDHRENCTEKKFLPIRAPFYIRLLEKENLSITYDSNEVPLH